VSDIVVKRLLVALLAIAAANLGVSLLQTTILVRRAAPGVPEAEQLPAKFSAGELRRIADTVVGPYNSDDLTGLYALFDDIAKVQVTRPKFIEQIGSLKATVGRVESSAFAGWERIPNQGMLPTYQLRYVVRLSGQRLSTGTMMINVVDRGDTVGVLGIFINGAIQQ
jgi:hypothetical protein